MYSESARPLDLFAALRAGAHGYLLKPCRSRRLCDELSSLLCGEPVISAFLLKILMDTYRDRSPRRRRIACDVNIPVGLTSREREVLELVARNCSTAEIATSLCMAQGTVRCHVSHILNKLGVSDRDDLRERLHSARIASDPAPPATPPSGCRPAEIWPTGLAAVSEEPAGESNDVEVTRIGSFSLSVALGTPISQALSLSRTDGATELGSLRSFGGVWRRPSDSMVSTTRRPDCLPLRRSGRQPVRQRSRRTGLSP